MEGSLLAAEDGGLFPQPFGFLPPADVVETDALVTLSVELPGLEQKDIDVSVEDGILTIRGEKNEEKKEENKKYHLLERTYGSFQRSFTVPRGVDSSKISAEFEKGVLKVMMPKTEDARAKGRQIPVTAK